MTESEKIEKDRKEFDKKMKKLSKCINSDIVAQAYKETIMSYGGFFEDVVYVALHRIIKEFNLNWEIISNKIIDDNPEIQNKLRDIIQEGHSPYNDSYNEELKKTRDDRIDAIKGYGI